MDFQVVIDSLTQIFTDIITFIPRLINGMIILIVGYLIARIVRWVLANTLRRLKFDPIVERTGITGSLRGLGVRMPLSQIMAQTIFILLLISFLITATRLMGLEAVAQLLEELLTFLPNVIAALIVFLIGGVAAKFMGDLVTTISAGAAMTYASRLGRIVQYLISVFVVVFALGVLGIDTGIIVTTLTIIIASFGLALSLALGLGARGVVQHILAGYYMRQRLPIDQAIVIDAVRGSIGSIGSVSTVVVTTDGSVVIPNARLLETLIALPQNSAPEVSSPITE